MSEKKPTEFPDWSHPNLKSLVLDFFRRFTERYDRDSRLAFVQVGFGLWAEYHIYDGPMRLGETFPSKEFQTEFTKHLSTCFQATPWMISVDAADSERAPYAESLKGLLPGQRRTFRVSAGGEKPKLTIECKRLVKGAVHWF